MIEVVIGLGAAVALIAWIVRRPPRGRAAPPPERHPDIDLAELEAAEREVRDAGPAGSTAADDDADDDWGPGAPRTGPR